jgi:hypothetical protein
VHRSLFEQSLHRFAVETKARLAEARTKAGDTAQAGAGLRDDGAATFAGLARVQDREMLGRIADAQRRAGFIAQAAATFEEALAAALSGDNAAMLTMTSPS